jgi:hypothetical protein
MLISCSRPGRNSTYGVSLLDHVFGSGRINYLFSGHFHFAGSDHDLCIVERKINNLKPRPRYISARNPRSVDWDIFQDKLEIPVR